MLSAAIIFYFVAAIALVVVIGYLLRTMFECLDDLEEVLLEQETIRTRLDRDAATIDAIRADINNAPAPR